MTSSDFKDGSISERYRNLDDIRASVIDFGHARDRFLDVARHLTAHAATDRIEMAGADLLRQAVTVARRLRHCIAAFRIHYALLWVRAQHCEEDEPEEPGVAASALGALGQKLELALERWGETAEGSSHDGKVSATVDHRMKLLDLDFEPRLLKDPEYRAAVIEAVNASIARAPTVDIDIYDALPTEPEPLESTAATVGNDTDDPIDHLVGALAEVEDVQYQVAQLLTQITRSQSLPPLAEWVDDIAQLCQEVEQGLRDHLPSLGGYHDLLNAKAQVPELTAADLTEVEGCVQLFLDEDLDEVDEPVGIPGVDVSQETRELVALVAGELRRQDEERKDRRWWQAAARNTRRQLAMVEQQTFEGRSSDGSVTARVSGIPRLIDLGLDAQQQGEVPAVKAAVIEAINSALSTAAHRRTMASMVMPDG